MSRDRARHAGLAAALLGLLAGCGQPSADLGGGTRAGVVGSPAPDFELPDLSGNPVRLSDSDGRVRLVDFWATWCAPCIEEIPMFKELHATYAEDGFVLIAVSMDLEGPEQVRPIVERYEIPYVNVMGNDEVAEGFGGVLGLPTAFLIDREGKIVERWMGPVPKKVFEKRIRELLGLDA